MAKVTTAVSNFSGGELSPQALGRFDLAKYPNSLKKMENFLINQLGGALFRPATKYIAGARYTDKKCRLMPFQYSADQDYVMEMGDLYLRFFSNSGSAVSIETQVDYVSDADTLVLLSFNVSPFVDSSSNSIAITNDGVTLDTSIKKAGAGSGLFADTKHLALADDAIFDISTGDFTVEYDVYYTTVNYHWDVNLGYGASGISILLDNSDQSINYRIGATDYDTGFIPTVSTWYNIAIVRESGVVKLFVDGVQAGADQTISTDIDMNTVTKWIGEYNAGGAGLTGNMDNFRFSKIARYDDTYTPGNFTTVSELTVDYLEADLFEIMQAHKNDVKYLTHEDYAPAKVSRTSATAFDIADVTLVRGPFLDVNITATTLTADADAGAGVTVTASGATFASTHIGSLWRILDGVVKITAYTSATVVTATVQAEPDGTAGDLNTGAVAQTDWAEGAFSEYRGYPKACTFHDGSFYYGGTTYEPQKIWKSVPYAYDNFNVGDGTDGYAATFEIATEERNAIQWLMSGQRSLVVGTTGGTFSVSGSSEGAITPDNIQITRDTTYGVTLLAPKRIGSFIYYIQRNLNKLREISYSFDKDTKIANDMNLLADHILRDGDGVLDLGQQQSPNDRMWCVRDDGQLAVITRNAEQDITGWSRMVAGRDSTGNGEFESVCVIPKQDTEDQVWVVVKRYIGGTVKRFIEYFTPENFDEDWDAVRVDSSVTLDDPGTITGMTNASPGVFSCTAHGFTTGDQVKINGVVLSDVSGEESTDVNGTYLLVEGADVNKFTITTLLGVAINTTTALGYGTYVEDGEVREMTTAISGLGHMEGEDVYVQADGVALTTAHTVASGAITLATKAAVVHAGFKYNGTLQLLKQSDGSATGVGQTKNRRISEVTIRVDRSLSMKIGLEEGSLDSVQFGDENDDVLTDLVTKDIIKLPISWWTKTAEIILRQDKPNPLNILCLIILSEVIDK